MNMNMNMNMNIMQKLMSYNVLKHQKIFPANVWTNES